MKQKLFLILFLGLFFNNYGWGFFAHKRINRLAVFTLPSEMLPFYKKNIIFITENAINPDQRRYAVDGEAPRHYIDIDNYGDSAIFKVPRYWNEAVKKFSEDSLMKHGINPWFVNKMKYQLTEAFKQMDAKRILRISADLGHYIADGNVPLHTTRNYNGQFTNQLGIHGFWESRLPELYSENYDFYVGPSSYVKNTQLKAWDAIKNAHFALDSVFGFEKLLTKKFSPDKKYTFDERSGMTIKTYSRPFSESYHQMLAGQVERRMVASIKMVGDFWFTAWVDAGQPNLNSLLEFEFSKADNDSLKNQNEEWKKKMLEVRPESFLKDQDQDGHRAHAGSCCIRDDFFSHKLLTPKNKFSTIKAVNHSKKSINKTFKK